MWDFLLFGFLTYCMRNFYFLLSFLLLSLSQLTAQQVQQRPQPSWVEVQDLDFENIKQNPDATGYQYLLADFQDNLEDEGFYKRFVFKILNSKGVEEMSDVSVNYDPSYQKLFFHHINIYRDGEVVKRLSPSDFKVIQRETDLDRNLYNGSVTALNHLSDIRIGDIIDYAYSLSGANPVHDGKYASSMSFQYDIPVDNFHFSLLVDENEKPTVKEYNNASKPTIEQKGNLLLYQWHLKDLEPLIYEANTPYWYDNSPMVQVSQFKSWEEVSRQYGKFYKINGTEGGYLKDRAASFIGASQEETITNLIRFVQDEVRYLGFEDGMNGFRPSSPKDVYERRFGDCKDKSFLLAELLKTQGVDARPVLVHSIMGKVIEDDLPSPFSFNHCIVQINQGKESIYVDPTMSNQGNTYSEMFFPDYKKGLVLATAKKLIDLPQPEQYQTEILETYELDSIGGGADLEIETTYRGRFADYQRAEFANNSNQNIQQSYLEFYSNAYPTISVLEDIETVDKRDDDNSFTVRESYRIDSLWMPYEEERNTLISTFEPLVLESYIFPVAASAGRKTPYYIDPTTNIVQKMVIYTPRAWNIENGHNAIMHPGFKYDYDVKYKNAKLEVTHTYKSLQDHIDPEEVASYLAEHKKIQDNVTYALTYNTSFLNVAGKKSSATSWPMVLLFMAVLIVSGFLCMLLYKNYDLPAKANHGEHLDIGGWLILIAIGLVLSPILIVFTGIIGQNFFDAATINAMYPDNIPMIIILALELTFNTMYLVFSVFIIVVFFKQRTIVPRLMIYFLAAPLVFNILDVVLVSTLYSELYSGEEIASLMGTILGSGIRAAIWIPYFLISTRVQKTFTRTLKPQELPDTPDESLHFSLPTGE
ncbi:MAG: hypothetical protein CL868_12695 [Cytophagaceae bacterium]|nr:hypothetical protein [Cytophagaceae bacterium]